MRTADDILAEIGELEFRRRRLRQRIADSLSRGDVLSTRSLTSMLEETKKRLGVLRAALTAAQPKT